MATYSKITDFAAKDALLTGNPSKIVKGTEIGAEFDSIATADASNVKGPTSAVTDNAVVRWDTTTGRISQGSSVTIDDSGNISGTSFTGAHNGTVGATTPSTGAFTTLSATSGASVTGALTASAVASGAGTGTLQIKGAVADSNGFNFTFDNSSNTAKINNFYNGSLQLAANNAVVATVSSTGLSVTGALSSSGNITTTGTACVYAANATTIGWGAGTTGFIGTSAGSTIDTYAGGSVVSRFSTTGLAVTGALSSTGSVTSGATVTATADLNSFNAENDRTTGVVTSSYVFSGNGAAVKARIKAAVYGDGYMAFTTNDDTEKMRLDASGNLGLGVAPSAWSGAKAFEFGGGNFVASNGGNGLYAGNNTYYNGTNWIYKATALASRYDQAVGQHQWFIAPSGTAGNAITFTQAMTLDASGNLLVGTTSVASSVASGGVQVYVNAFGTGQTTFDIGHITGTPTATAYQRYVYNGTVIGTVTQSGTTAVLYNTTSDYRLKTVIAPVSGAGERIDALNPVEYEWKSDGQRTRGFLAHEFQSVYAQSVSGTKDAVDADGNPVYQSMQAGSSEVIADLVAEIKSLRARLAAAGIA